MNVLVTGVSGYVGALVATRLSAEGHAVRGFARRPGRVTIDAPVIAGDAVSGVGLEQAMDGIEVAYFLIHSMETGGSERFAAREHEAARRFGEAARRAGVRRIVYLGGPLPPGVASEHLASRLAVERCLLDAVPDSIALRASIVIGARSRSFRFLVRLVERLPVLTVPSWGDNRTAPIDERDMLAMLAQAADVQLSPPTARPGDAARAGHVLDAAGPDVVSYRQLMQRIAESMLVDRPTVTVRRLALTPITSRVAAAVAGEDPGLVQPLMESLHTDLLATGEDAAATLTVRLHGLDAAIEHALREWEETETLAAR